MVGSGALRQAWARKSKSEHSELICRSKSTYLNQVLALRLGDQWLELRGGKGIDQAGLGHDQQQHLGACEDGQFVCLGKISINEPDVAKKKWQRTKGNAMVDNVPSS